MPSTHIARLERWLGPHQVEQLAASMREWHGPPIPIANVPGRVYAVRGGDFVGPLRGGYFGNLYDFTEQRAKRILRNASRRQLGRLHAGFTSLSDLISEATVGGKSQVLPFVIAGAAGVAARSNSTWGVGSWPPIGAAGGTAGTGAACTRSTVGALGQQNAAGGDQLHITTMTVQGSVAGQMLLLYDRLWHMTHTMTVDPQAVNTANPPTRYQTAATAPGSFITGHVTTVLPAATPTIAFTYVDQDGNASAAGPALSTIASAAAVGTIPFTAPNWFYPITPGDTGVRSITNVDLSAAMASGVVTWAIGHPLVMCPIGAANVPIIVDGINSAFNLQRVYDDACLTFLELCKSATTATNWWGMIEMVSG